MKTINDFADRVFVGDCVNELAKLPPASVDFVLTDPPYGARYRPRDGRSVTGDDRTDSLKPAFREIYRVLKPDSFCVSFYGWHKVDVFFEAWRGAGFQPVGHLVWPKQYPSSARFLQYFHESAYLLAKGRPAKPKTLISDVVTEWSYTGNKLHPTQKPVSALLPVISALTRPGDIVLDPFCGSGSTLFAAKALHRRYIGIDIEPEHARTAEARVGRR